MTSIRINEKCGWIYEKSADNLNYKGENMIEQYITDKWQTMKRLHAHYIADDINKNKRNVRRDIEKYNQAYYDGKSNNMIVYSSQGYKLTSDSREIEKCMNKHMQQAIIHFKKYHKIAKVRGCKLNMSIEDLLEL